MYDDCSVILKEFDKDNCQFSKDIESLLNVYADAAKNVIIISFVTSFKCFPDSLIVIFFLQQGSAVLWSQMPIDLFIKQIELYNHYLGVHIKKQFSTNKEEQEEDSDYGSLISDSRDKQMDERMHELFLCKTK